MRCLAQVEFPRAANQDCVEATVGGARRKLKLHEAKAYGVLARTVLAIFTIRDAPLPFTIYYLLFTI
jgi:hypothetical protein